MCGEFEPFGLGARGQQFDDLLDQGFDRHRPWLHAPTSGRDPADIQHVVDQRQKRGRRRGDSLNVAFLLGAQRRPVQQIRHAEDSIQRRSQFMASQGDRMRLARECGLRRRAARSRCIQQGIGRPIRVPPTGPYRQGSETRAAIRQSAPKRCPKTLQPGENRIHARRRLNAGHPPTLAEIVDRQIIVL